jgi:hypothetical protein
LRTIVYLGAVALLALEPLGAQGPDPAEMQSRSVRALHDLRKAAAVFDEYIDKRDLLRIHGWDQLTNPAVNTLYQARSLARAGQEEGLAVAVLTLSRTLVSLHEAVHAVDQTGAEARYQEFVAALAAVEDFYPEDFLKAVDLIPDTYTCPMHPDVIGRADGVCPKCGMALVTAGPFSSLVSAPPTIRVGGARWGPNLSPGRETQVSINLRRDNGSPVLLTDLLLVHTQRIHLLIIDETLTDYHHEHPEPTAVAGEYVFRFTPRKAGSYRVWADLLPADTGRQEYVIVDVVSWTAGNGSIDRVARDTAVVDGLTYHLILDQPSVRAGRAVRARVRVTDADGRPFTGLEPVMGAFGHLVGFKEDRKTVLHSHPLGLEPSTAAARGGPDLDFYIYSADPGFVRLFAQVQIGGVARFADFGVIVAP